MKYLFLFGRNVELSLAEVFSYFEKEGFGVNLEGIQLNGALLDSKEKLNIKEMIDQLGGTVAIGEVLFYGDLDKVAKKVGETPIYSGTSNKPSYSVFNFADENASNVILSGIKNNLKKEKLKTKYVPLKGSISMQVGETIFGSPSQIKKLDERYFLFKKESLYFFGKLSEVFDSKESERRDMGKPARRESLAISPRLAKILINLSSVKENGTLFDPFCGIGVILQEALLNKINVLGVDLNEEAIKDCKKNLDWLRQEYDIKSKSQVINNDSGKIILKQKINGVATEPSLGKLLRQIPKKEDALKMISDFENLIVYVLRNVRKYLAPNSKITFTSPFIRVAKKRIACNIDDICSRTGLKKCKLKNYDVTFPIQEFREAQIVGREIYVLTVN